MLLAASGGRRALELDRLTRNDRSHLRSATRALADDGHPAWLTVGRDDRVVAQRAFAAVAAARDAASVSTGGPG